MIINTPQDINIPRVDFNQNSFDSLLKTKGRRIIWEKAIICPCREITTGSALSTCKNCGSTGWVFINPKNINILIHSLGIKNDFSNWSEEARGTINCSSPNENDITSMDKLTIVDAISYFDENLQIHSQNNQNFVFLSYEPKQIQYCALFESDSLPLRRLNLGTDYTIVKNKLIVSNTYSIVDLKVSIRYSHAPVYHVLEMQRESMETFANIGNGEVLLNMPFSFLAKRAHYLINYQNQSSDTLLNNSF
jgi:hypothetical protein